MSMTETGTAPQVEADDPFADGTQAELVSEGEALAMGFSDEDLAALWDAGVLVREDQVERWEPRDLDDLDWLIAKRKQLRHEKADLIDAHAAAVARLDRAAKVLERWDVLCLKITDENLDRDRNGKPRSKSIPLQHGVVKIRSSKGGPKVEDEAAVLAWLLEQDEKPAALVDALKVSVTEVFEGAGALAVLTDPAYDDLRKPKVLHKPVQEYVSALPGTPGEHGVSLPATIPGVVLVPPSDEWLFD